MSDEHVFPNQRIAGWVGIVSLWVVFALAACQPAPAPLIEGDGTPTRPDLVGLIEWDRSPSTVVFRALQTGGDSGDFLRLGDVAACTIFGDNSMVYLLPGSEGGTVVAVDKVPDEAIRSFVEDLTLNYQLFNQASGLGNLAPELIPPTYETLAIAINGQSFNFDSLGGWDSDYYAGVIERCRAVSAAPAEFAPEDGAWVSARIVTYNPDQPALIWDAVAANLDLAKLAEGERQWVKGAGVVALWDRLRLVRPDLQLQQGEVTYQVAIQVRGITLNAPEAP